MSDAKEKISSILISSETGKASSFSCSKYFLSWQSGFNLISSKFNLFSFKSRFNARLYTIILIHDNGFCHLFSKKADIFYIFGKTALCGVVGIERKNECRPCPPFFAAFYGAWLCAYLFSLFWFCEGSEFRKQITFYQNNILKNIQSIDRRM